MAKVKEVQKYDVQQAIGLLMDSNVSVQLASVENYKALVTEVTENGTVEGTILYIPGISYRTLQGK